MIKNKQECVWAKCSTETAEAYRGFSKHRKRSGMLSKIIAQMGNVNSVFEVGLMGGRNIEVIKNENKISKYGGIDICQAGVDTAKKYMPGGDFDCCSVYDLDTNDKYDLVFTMGVMIHIPPDGIDLAIEKMIGKATKYIVHCEAIGKDIVFKGPKELNPQKVSTKFQWKPDLIKRYEQLGFGVTKYAVPAKLSSDKDITHTIIIKL